ncbi:MAG: chaperone modulator CbpM [Acetobacteraceae bacterium]
MQIAAVLTLFPDLRETEVLTWVERGWVRPARAGEEWTFEEIDIARVRLLHDLRYDMAVAEETMPLVLSLLDQVYDLRARMRAIGRVVETQDERVREAILAVLRG